jgi:hypothetical protein
LARTSTEQFEQSPDSGSVLRDIREPPPGLAQSINNESLNYTRFETGTENSDSEPV